MCFFRRWSLETVVTLAYATFGHFVRCTYCFLRALQIQSEEPFSAARGRPVRHRPPSVEVVPPANEFSPFMHEPDIQGLQADPGVHESLHSAHQNQNDDLQFSEDEWREIAGTWRQSIPIHDIFNTVNGCTKVPRSESRRASLAQSLHSLTPTSGQHDDQKSALFRTESRLFGKSSKSLLMPDFAHSFNSVEITNVETQNKTHRSSWAAECEMEMRAERVRILWAKALWYATQEAKRRRQVLRVINLMQRKQGIKTGFRAVLSRFESQISTNEISVRSGDSSTLRVGDDDDYSMVFSESKLSTVVSEVPTRVSSAAFHVIASLHPRIIYRIRVICCPQSGPLSVCLTRYSPLTHTHTQDGTSTNGLLSFVKGKYWKFFTVMGTIWFLGGDDIYILSDPPLWADKVCVSIPPSICGRCPFLPLFPLGPEHLC